MADFSFGNDVSNTVGNQTFSGGNSVSTTSYQVGAGPAISKGFNENAVGQPAMNAPVYGQNGPQNTNLNDYNAKMSQAQEGLKTGGIVRKAPGLGR